MYRTTGVCENVQQKSMELIVVWNRTTKTVKIKQQNVGNYIIFFPKINTSMFVDIAEPDILNSDQMREDFNRFTKQ